MQPTPQPSPSTTAHALDDFPALMGLRHQPDLLAALRAEHPAQDEFIEHASLLILRSVFQTHNPNRITRDAFDPLLKRGHSIAEICSACALALYENNDTFYLQTKDMHYRYLRNHHLALYAIIAAFTTIVLTVEFAPKSEAAAVATVLVFEPVLAFIGVLLSVAYFYLLRLLIRRN